jgi:hypothetical protein
MRVVAERELSGLQVCEIGVQRSLSVLLKLDASDGDGELMLGTALR